jgi:hypothetical protein
MSSARTARTNDDVIAPSNQLLDALAMYLVAYASS